eukprot:354439-Chlamydomonas_euryale.AAC.1
MPHDSANGVAISNLHTRMCVAALTIWSAHSKGFAEDLDAPCAIGRHPACLLLSRCLGAVVTLFDCCCRTAWVLRSHCLAAAVTKYGCYRQSYSQLVYRVRVTWKSPNFLKSRLSVRLRGPGTVVLGSTGSQRGPASMHDVHA